MNKKGFTLVELLGTIVVLAIILTIAIPSIVQTMRRAEINEANAFITRLYNAGETYIEINREAFEQLKTTGGFVDIPIALLLEEALIKELGNDPETLAAVTANDTLTATRLADGTIEYELYKQNTNIASYIQDGLVFHLDAINNFGFGHSNTTTIWNDLSNNHSDVTLKNFNNNSSSGWNNSFLRFDGTNDFLETVSTPIVLGNNWTVDMYLNYTNQSKTYEFILGTTNNSGSFGKILMRYNSFISYSFPVNTYNNFTTTSASVSGSKRHIAIVSDSSTVKLYVNGVLSQTQNIVNAPMSISTIGNAWTDNAWHARFDLYSLKTYNRALAIGEIQNNYNLDTIRFR